MTINKEWHQIHKMPLKATLEQRIEWHLEHHKNCLCMPIPEKLLTEMKNRNIDVIISKETKDD